MSLFQIVLNQKRIQLVKETQRRQLLHASDGNWGQGRPGYKQHLFGWKASGFLDVGLEGNELARQDVERKMASFGGRDHAKCVSCAPDSRTAYLHHWLRRRSSVTLRQRRRLVGSFTKQRQDHLGSTHPHAKPMIRRIWIVVSTKTQKTAGHGRAHRSNCTNNTESGICRKHGLRQFPGNSFAALCRRWCAFFRTATVFVHDLVANSHDA